MEFSVKAALVASLVLMEMNVQDHLISIIWKVYFIKIPVIITVIALFPLGFIVLLLEFLLFELLSIF